MRFAVCRMKSVDANTIFMSLMAFILSQLGLMLSSD